MKKRGTEDLWRIILGVILLGFSIFSIYSLVNGVEAWYISSLLFEIVLIILGIVFLRYSLLRLKRFDVREMLLDLVISIFLIFFGLFPLGLDFDLFSFLPFAVELSVSAVILAVVLLSFGAYLLVDEFVDMFW